MRKGWRGQMTRLDVGTLSGVGLAFLVDPESRGAEYHVIRGSMNQKFINRNGFA